MSDIKLEISIEINADEHSQLISVFEVDDQGLKQKLVLVAQAALSEYLRMILGQKVFSRASDIFEYRLLLLVKEVFGNVMPEEQKVGDFFQMTESRAGALIRAASSKYRFELNQALNQSLSLVVQSAKKENKKDGDWEITDVSRAVITNLNSLLSKKDGTLPAIKSRTDAVSTFVIKPSAYTKLCEILKINPKK